jgi:hypothetical protein
MRETNIQELCDEEISNKNAAKPPQETLWVEQFSMKNFPARNFPTVNPA